jgi:hypothetical protein
VVGRKKQQHDDPGIDALIEEGLDHSGVEFGEDAARKILRVGRAEIPGGGGFNLLPGH